MAKIIHEVWEEIGERGETMPGLFHAGPAGEGFRKLLAADARASVPNPKFAALQRARERTSDSIRTLANL